MASGSGKYDEACTGLRQETDADCVIAIVIGGSKGSGFSVQSRGKSLLKMLPLILRDVADQIEMDMKEGLNDG